ncbi:hypothetical protein R0381_003627 [Jeongeupia wiesaeckerbachi]|uniref:hypothetical protein n=1 Tax=Jeongeupia wiesaeckerbachi TaxID=3051218 RepID=UPI003D805BAF
MAAVEVLAGDFPPGRAEFGWGLLVFPKKPKQGFPAAITVKPSEELLTVEQISEEAASRMAGAAGLGLAGGAMFGVAGLVIGGLLGAVDKKPASILLAATFTEGRKMLAKTDRKTFEKLQATAFTNF